MFEYLLSCYVICGRVHKNAMELITFKLWLSRISIFVVAAKAEKTRGQFASGFEHCMQKCKAWRELVANFFSTVCCIGLYSVCCPKITIVSAVMIISSVVTLAKSMPFGLLHLQAPRFWELRQIRLNFRNLTFFQLFTVSCPRNDMSTNRMKYLRERDNVQSLKSLNLWTLEERWNMQDLWKYLRRTRIWMAKNWRVVWKRGKY